MSFSLGGDGHLYAQTAAFGLIFFSRNGSLAEKVGKIMFLEDDLVPLSALQHVVYCPRRAALVHMEAAWGDSSSTVEGSIFHDRAHEPGTESRGNVRIARGVHLRSLSLGLTGKADVVEFHKVEESEVVAGAGEGGVTAVRLDGVSGLWKPYPVEYKVGKLRSERAYEVQLCGQALCLEEMLGVKIPAAAIYFGKTARRMEIILDMQLRGETAAAAALLHQIFASRVTPQAKYGKKCPKCSLFDLCMPRATEGTRKVKAYLKSAIRDITGDDS
jgi:CRISPR-associated exonuclease Cas4